MVSPVKSMFVPNVDTVVNRNALPLASNYSIIYVDETGTFDATVDAGTTWSNITLNGSSPDFVDMDMKGQLITWTGGVLGASYAPCIIYDAIADGAISVTSLLKQSPTTDFRVVETQPGDGDGVPIIGYAVSSSASAGDIVKVCFAQMITVTTDSVTTLNRGQAVEKSDTNAGRVRNGAGGGVVGSAAEPAGINTSFSMWISNLR